MNSSASTMAPCPIPVWRSIQPATYTARLSMTLRVVAMPETVTFSRSIPAANSAFCICSVHADPNCNDGQYPVSSPVLDASGDLWGTTAGGGANNGGTLYKINSAGKERVVYNFANEYESVMQGDLTRDAQGNFYTVKYARNFNTTDGGKIFKITPSGQESEPYTFCTLPGCPGGDVPRGPIQIDAAGNLYGVVTQGGANGTGGVFEVNTSGTETLLHSFEKGILTFFNGIVIDSAGNLYGTTTTGGPNKHGTVYKLTLQK